MESYSAASPAASYSASSPAASSSQVQCAAPGNVWDVEDVKANVDKPDHVYLGANDLITQLQWDQEQGTNAQTLCFKDTGRIAMLHGVFQVDYTGFTMTPDGTIDKKAENKSHAVAMARRNSKCRLTTVPTHDKDTLPFTDMEQAAGNVKHFESTMCIDQGRSPKGKDWLLTLGRFGGGQCIKLLHHMFMVRRIVQ